MNVEMSAASRSVSVSQRETPPPLPAGAGPVGGWTAGAEIRKVLLDDSFIIGIVNSGVSGFGHFQAGGGAESSPPLRIGGSCSPCSREMSHL
jgi:hypothetical protein